LEVIRVMACPPLSGRRSSLTGHDRSVKPFWRPPGKATDKGVARGLLGGIRHLDAGGLRVEDTQGGGRSGGDEQIDEESALPMISEAGRRRF
jgi:hypothetical protein